MHEAAKVAHVMRRFTRDKWGGTETVVYNLARECEEAGVPSPIFCTDMFAAPGEEKLHGVSIRRFPYTFPWLFLDEDAKAKLRLKGGSPLSWGLFRALMKEPGLSIILPTVHEPFGIVILEAWAAGTPVVATRVGGIPGFTTDGANIRLFDLNGEDQLLERMNEMAGSAELRGRLRRAAFAEVSEHYDWSMIARQMRDIYAEAIARHGARAGGGAK